jgi:hypothetical protein
MALKRLAAAANQQGAPVFNDYAADAYDRPFRIFSGGAHFRRFIQKQFTIEAAALGRELTSDREVYNTP